MSFLDFFSHHSDSPRPLHEADGCVMADRLSRYAIPDQALRVNQAVSDRAGQADRFLPQMEIGDAQAINAKSLSNEADGRAGIHDSDGGPYVNYSDANNLINDSDGCSS